jgi:hypothetical protein
VITMMQMMQSDKIKDGNDEEDEQWEMTWG